MKKEAFVRRQPSVNFILRSAEAPPIPHLLRLPSRRDGNGDDARPAVDV